MLKRTLLLATAAAAALILAAPAAHASTVWLCKPGLAKNPCLPSLKTTLISPTGKTTGTDNVKREKNPLWDCFYVYPTVSDQKRPQATKHIDAEERSIALYQTAYYSRDCRVYAPMYRQITIQGLLQPDTVTPAMRTRAYNDVRDAFRDYLHRYNKGRGIVLISHSQGSFVLRQLIAKEVDRKPAVSKKLISAVLLGGNVLVKKGKTTGGDFKNVPACRSNKQFGCVIAWSTYNETPPDNSLFGRTTTARPGLPAPPKGTEVLCTNPAALGGGSGKINPVFPTEPFAPGTIIGSLTTQVGFTVPSDVKTPWVEVPKAYRATCSSAGGAHVLRISSLRGAPKLNAVPDATWGLHLVDANIAQGDLLELIRKQALQYLAH